MRLLYQSNRAFFSGGAHGAIHDLLPDPAESGIQRPMEGATGLEVVDQVLDGVAEAFCRCIDWHRMGLWLILGLKAHHGLVVVAGDRPPRAQHHKTALGLGLEGPRVGEGSPARLKLREAVGAGVATDRDGVLIDLKARLTVGHTGHFDRLTAAQEPGSEGDAIAEVVLERAPCGRLLVPPRLRLLSVGLLFGDLDLIGDVAQGPPVAIVVVDLDHLTNGAFIDEALGGDMRGVPREGPVDDHGLARRSHGGDHAIRLAKAGGEGLLDKDMGFVGRDIDHVLPVLARLGA